MSLAAQLWTENADVVAEVLANPFVRGIGDGSLDRDLFAGYIAQDAFFLESFARAYGLALARSSDTATLLTFADLLAGVREELGLHASYAASWGIDMAGVEPAAATLAYTEFLLATAATADIGVVCAAMTPCMRLYAHIGVTLDADAAGPYAQWVQTYADPGFEEVASLLERLLDQQADDVSAARIAYRRAMRLELAFFDAAFNRGDQT
ncbi:TenA family transcriptional regulator [Mycolicibacterium novocastrense]|uniref:TenA family protein n=1 Tax=Mycolicibacterium novocastrense TaxID=59813 RepID=A0AAW5SPC3_MYCNV|nr:TenA family protein [Mycolicibacterium novocastrense]KUH70811.1 TenA family transcriptional regulator [Mycolicibacterium novocastrense]KUH71152.1 TenA family transcriptional regulator [Mycolicibacterium novocastrense]KUH73331.1 TenA family transcriptional regulator [Mycolicibacterium novocastrense]MCV7025485.1 TenA family protein [Mycolicibacterium novocastrense]GAT08959.1 TenA family transcriptional activator [Mycolicibacterium novocastrense]